ncbi:hypothetical protein [Aurantimonas endophytica]|uniref:Uncharacterized protein n=1 Tax=Aurantimonas endophytica TaxID=1522175 RepID=A0A7W6HFT9_9HYPH|nr:hypothetical protein [Aurantimonas endophytica]MBB4004465.1 hypothetical protein [Aurantimonas endophytica]MCO6405301.1 hypothetical protein [Aurantimonas endophytica]
MDRVSQLETRIERLEALLAGFAGAIVDDARRERGARTIRNLADAFSPHTAAEVDADIRRIITVEAVRLIRAGGEVSHADLVRSLKGKARSNRIKMVMTALAVDGEIWIRRDGEGKRGRPSIVYGLVKKLA